MSRHLFFSGSLSSNNEFAVAQLKIDPSFKFRNVRIERVIIKGLKISGTAPDCIPSASHFHLSITGSGNSTLGDSNFIVRSLSDNLPGWPVPMGNEKFLNVDYNPPVKVISSQNELYTPILEVRLLSETGTLLNTTTELTNGATYAIWLFLD